jgi:hypothetical protein
MQNQPSSSSTEKPVLEPNTQAFLDALAAKGGPQIYELSIKDARGVLSGAQAGKVAKQPADIEDRAIPGGPKGDVSLRILRPKGKTGVLPVVMYFHGGGWVLSDQDTHESRIEREVIPRWPVTDRLTLDLRNRLELRWLEGRSVVFSLRRGAGRNGWRARAAPGRMKPMQTCRTGRTARGLATRGVDDLMKSYV